MPLNTIVCIKQVPDWEAPADTFKIDPEQKKIIPPPNIDPRISLFDEHAIEAALQIREKHGGKVTILSLGPDFAQHRVLHDVSFRDRSRKKSRESHVIHGFPQCFRCRENHGSAGNPRHLTDIQCV